MGGDTTGTASDSGEKMAFSQQVQQGGEQNDPLRMNRAEIDVWQSVRARRVWQQWDESADRIKWQARVQHRR